MLRGLLAARGGGGDERDVELTQVLAGAIPKDGPSAGVAMSMALVSLLTDRTIRNVARGVIGTALIQSLLVGIGLVVAEVPAAAFLTLIAFLLCVVQIGPALVLLGATIYVFTYGGPLAGFVFVAWSVLVGTCDNFIRPMLMSRGGDVPLAVILIGTIGGLLAHGLIGLFVGPVVFALGYQLFRAWAVGDPLDHRKPHEAPPAVVPQPHAAG